MNYLKSINQIRVIEWGRTYLWDVRIPDAPPPFKQWFPAIDISVTSGNVSSHEIPIGNNNIKLPYSTTSHQ